MVAGTGCVAAALSAAAVAQGLHAAPVRARQVCLPAVLRISIRLVRLRPTRTRQVRALGGRYTRDAVAAIPGAIHSLVRLLREGVQSPLAQAAAEVLRNLAISPAMKDSLREAGVLDASASKLA